MSTLYITEYRALAIDGAGSVIATGKEPGVDSTLAISGSSASALLNANTKFVRLHTDVVCSVVFAAPNTGTPTAQTTNKRLAAGQTEFFGVPLGGTQIAVISNT